MAATLTLWPQLASPVMRPPNVAPHVMDVIESAHYSQYSSQNVYTEPNHGEMRQNLDWGTLQTPPGFPGGSDGKESACNAGDIGLIAGSGKFPWRREWLPTLVFLPGKFHGQGSLADYSPWGHKELDKTEHVNKHSFRCPQSRSDWFLTHY